MAVIVIGNTNDEHVQAVLAHLDGLPCVVTDASSLDQDTWRWTGELELLHDGQWLPSSAGWLRRLAAPGSHHGLTFGSIEYVEAVSRLTALSSFASRGSRTRWLSDYWSIMRAESKLVQHQVARSLGLRTPDTAMVTDRAHIPWTDERVVAKPLVGGGFQDRDESYAIHANVLDRSDERLDALGAAPFLLQRVVAAVRHLRVPTVAGRAWVCELDAAGVPFDWRTSETAHYSWRETRNSVVCQNALRIAEALGVGYSCQDWVEDADGHLWLLDVNPAGQWLFLPDEVATSVSRAIAEFLRRQL